MLPFPRSLARTCPRRLFLAADQTPVWLLCAFATLAPALAATSPVTEPTVLVAASPRSGLLEVLHEGQPYLSFGYYDWDVDWGQVQRRQELNEEKDAVAFIYRHTLPSSKATFTITGGWRRLDARQYRFEAELRAETKVDLTLAQFSLSPAPRFGAGTVVATHAGGRTRVVPLPLERGTLGTEVTRLELRDAAGRISRLEFDQPVAIDIDQQLRVVLARGQVDPKLGAKLGWTMILPEDATFVAGPASVPKSNETWFEFTGASPIPAESQWSLASWLETPAGRHGRVRAEGDRLVYNGAPIKLWGINVSYAACAPEKALADRRADFYASVGINAVRLHKYADGHGWAGILRPDTAAAFDAAGLERMDYFIAALKKRGIYTKLSPVFIIKPGPADLDAIPYLKELGSLDSGRVNPRHGSLYVSTELQDLLIRQIVTLLKHRNPHTGLRYAEDPAIAYVEIYNEDSALFGGINPVLARSPTLRARAGSRFAAWLKTKYGDEASFLAAWGPRALNGSLLSNQNIPRDESWPESRIYPVGNPWFFDPTNLDSSQRNYRRRLLDTMAFLHELQNEVYDRCVAAIRATGYEGELIASNWQAGRMMSHFYNLHSDYRVGTIDRHNYFAGDRGDAFRFDSASMLAVPGGGSLSASLQQVADRPFMLSEWIHVSPNEWTVEGPAILGAYGMGLQGWDASFPFQNRDGGTFSRAIGVESWDAASPAFLGIFPAVSRQVHRGDVAESTVVHERKVHLPSLDEGKVGFDDRVSQSHDIKNFDSDVFPTGALAAARGVVRFTDSFEATPTFDLDAHRRDGAIVSATGQLRWHPGAHDKDGAFVIDSAGTQAVVGFAAGRAFNLGDAEIRPASRFGAIYLSAQSRAGTIATDRGILVTAIARARNAGSIILADTLIYSRGKIEHGRPAGPVLMEPVVFELNLRREGLPIVHILDHNGVKTGRTLPVADGTVRFDTGRDGSPYYLIEY